MSVNDFYYNTVAKQHAKDLWAEAEDARLAKVARGGARRQRAARREARRLEAAVEGRGGLRYALRTLFARRPATTTGDPATPGQTGHAADVKPAPTARR